MIALAASSKSPGARARDQARPSRRRTSRRRAARRSRRSRRGRSRRSCSRRPSRRCSAVNLVAARPVLPVKALALPELTTSARALPALRLARHHSTGADGHFDLVNTPATRGAGIEQRQQHVGAVLVADAGRGGREPHAGDRRHVGNVVGARGETAVLIGAHPMTCGERGCVNCLPKQNARHKACAGHQ